MKICLLCTEIFAFGKYGGFGRTTRMLGRELARRGLDVSAIVPKREGQQEIEKLDGFLVYGFGKFDLFKLRSLTKKIDADIYHSQQPSLLSHIAMKTMPDRKHLITCRDCKGFRDWLIEMKYPSVSKIRSFCAAIYENNFLVRRALKRANGVYYCARFLESKVKKDYRIQRDLHFLPTPVVVPERYLQKAQKPTVCFLARWDRRKRPEVFFSLAEIYPEVHFIAPGKSQDPTWDRELRERFGKLPNLTMPGFVDQFSSNQLSDLLEKSWILINTATREGLPTSFLEALAHQSALLSAVNPEEVTHKFGYYVTDNDFSKGLQHLLENDRWKDKGIAGQKYVLEHYELENAIEKHLTVYGVNPCNCTKCDRVLDGVTV